MKLNKSWLLELILLLISFIFVIYVIWSYALSLLTNFPQFLFIADLAALLGAALFIVDLRYGRAFYKRIYVREPWEGYEVRNYRNKSIIGYNDYAYEFFTCIKDPPKAVITRTVYYSIKKKKVGDIITSYKQSK